MCSSSRSVSLKYRTEFESVRRSSHLFLSDVDKIAPVVESGLGDAGDRRLAFGNEGVLQQFFTIRLGEIRVRL